MPELCPGLQADALRHPPFRGRETEFARLVAHWREAACGHGRLVLVTGDAGIGKTRLLDEFRAWVEHSGEASLGAASCLDMVEAEPFTALQQWFGSHTSTAKHSLREGLAEIAAELPVAAVGMIPFWGIVAALLVKGGIAAGRQALQGRGASQLRDDLHLVVLDQLRRLTRRRPLLLTIENLHWCDRSSLGLLAYLADQIADIPTLIIGTCRSDRAISPHHGAVQDFRRSLVRNGLLNEIMLGGLDAEALGAVMDALVTPAGMVPQLRTDLVELADGSPLFLIDLVRSNVQANRLILAGDLWQLAEGASLRDLSLQIEAIAEAQFSGLPSEARVLLQAGAVLGQSFSLRLLRDLLEPDELAIAQAQNAWREAALVYVADETSGILAFTRPHLRRFAAAKVLAQTARDWHLRAGQLMADAPQRYGANDRLVADHFAAAECWEMAGEHYLLYAEQCREALGYWEASSSYRRAADAFSRVDGPEARQKECDILLRLGMCGELTGQADASRTALHQCLEMLPPERQADSARAMMALGRLAFEDCKWADAYDWFMAAFRSHGALGDALGQAQVYNNVAAVHLREGRAPEAMEAWAAAQDLAKQCGGDTLWAKIEYNLGVLTANDDPDKALEHYNRAREAVALLSSPEAREVLFLCDLGIGALLTEMGSDLDSAEERLTDALRLADELGDVRKQAQAKRNLAFWHERHGNFAEALPLYADAVRTFRETGHRHWWASALGRQGICLLECQHRQEGVECLRQSVAELRRIGDTERADEYERLI